MPNGLIDLLGTLPVELVITYAWTKVLTMRSVRLFWCVWAVSFAIFCPIRSALPAEVRLAVMVFYSVVLPLVMSTGRLSRRLFAIALVDAVIFASELAGSAVWFALVHLPIIDYDAIRAHLPEYALTHLIHFLLVISLLSGVRAFVNRRVGAGEDYGLRLFMWFPMVQVVLLSLMAGINQYAIPYEAEEGFYFGLGILALACVAVDALLFRSMERYKSSRCDGQRAKLLEEELGQCLAQYDDAVEEIERTSQFRHDFRNQLHVVSVMAARGESQEALEHLALLENRVRSASPTLQEKHHLEARS